MQSYYLIPNYTTSYAHFFTTQAARNISPGVGISMSIPYAAMPIGIVFMILTSIEVVLKNIALLTNKEVNS